jgi:hypothetical protein
MLLSPTADLQPRGQETHQNRDAGKQHAPSRLRGGPAVCIDGVGLVFGVDIECLIPKFSVGGGEIVRAGLRPSGRASHEQHAGSTDPMYEPLLRLHAASSWRSGRQSSDLPQPGVIMELQSVASVANAPPRLAKPGRTNQRTSLSRTMATESAHFSVLRRLSNTSPKSVTVRFYYAVSRFDVETPTLPVACPSLRWAAVL